MAGPKYYDLDQLGLTEYEDNWFPGEYKIPVGTDIDKEEWSREEAEIIDSFLASVKVTPKIRWTQTQSCEYVPHDTERLSTGERIASIRHTFLHVHILTGTEAEGESRAAPAPPPLRSNFDDGCPNDNGIDDGSIGGCPADSCSYDSNAANCGLDNGCPDDGVPDDCISDDETLQEIQEQQPQPRQLELWRVDPQALEFAEALWVLALTASQLGKCPIALLSEWKVSLSKTIKYHHLSDRVVTDTTNAVIRRYFQQGKTEVVPEKKEEVAPKRNKRRLHLRCEC